MTAMMVATDFADSAWLFTRDVAAHTQPNGAATLTVQRTGSGYDVDADMRSGGWIVVAETAWPGWRAYVDGRRVKTIPVNVAFFGVYVPLGRHHVQIVYLPDAFVRGRAISIATMLMLVIGFGVRRLRP
ncbi:MAG TPA: YfhO family protein, partial [Thermoanaerobaculia bacterium]